jgi:hypothetical protein
VAPGVWVLGNDHIKGWIISGLVNQKGTGMQRYPPHVFEIFASTFVLLSVHPPPWKVPGVLLSESEALIVDGSNPGWYSGQLERFKAENLLAFDEYSTNELGAYLKRW